MVWYNPFTWLSQTPEVPTTILYCDSPQCQQLIDSDFMVYSPAYGEVYHLGSLCTTTATAHKTLHRAQEGNFQPLASSFTSITRRQALHLLREGRLKQSPSIDDIVADGFK